MPKETIQERQDRLKAVLVEVLEQHRTVLAPFEAWLKARREALADDLLREGSDVVAQRGRAAMLTEMNNLLREAAPDQGEDTDG